MTKYISSALTILLLAGVGPLAAQTPEPAGRQLHTLDAPALRINPAIKDFGPAWTGMQLRCDFAVGNAGRSDLVIQRIDYGPNCYQVGDYKAKLAPEEATTLSIAVDTREITGDFERTATLHTNDPRSPTKTLRLSGTCKPPLEIKPSFIGFGKVIGEGPQQRSLTIINKTDESFEMSLAESEDAHYKYELIETTPGEEYQLFATTKVPLTQGRVESHVTLRTSLEAQPTLPVRVFAYVPPRMEVMPAIISLDPDKLQNSPRGLTKVVVCSNNGDRPIYLRGVMVDDPAINITTTDIMPGKSYRVVVQVPRGHTLPRQGVILTIQTDDPDFASIRVPIRMAATQERTAPPHHAPDTTISKLVGKKAPSFELTTTEGVAVTNADLADAITVLNFFALGDRHNHEQLQKIEELRAQYAPRGIRFINVSQRSPLIDTSQERQVEFFQKADYKSELAFDLGNTVGTAFHLILYPTMVVLSKTGIIEGIVEGNEDDLIERANKQFDTLLSGRSIAAAPTPAEKQRRPALTMIGEKSPSFTLRLDEETTVATSDLASAPATVLNFVAPNCGFCRRQVPTVESVRPGYEEKGVRFINVGQTMRKEFSRAETEKVFRDAGSKLPLAYDPKNEVGKLFKVSGYPTMVIIRRDGQIQDVIIGAKRDLDDLMRAQLDLVLAGEKDTATKN